MLDYIVLQYIRAHYKVKQLPPLNEEEYAEIALDVCAAQITLDNS